MTSRGPFQPYQFHDSVKCVFLEKGHVLCHAKIACLLSVQKELNQDKNVLSEPKYFWRHCFGKGKTCLVFV